MLKVNEIFGPTRQGEGASVGKEVLFLRLALCNLKCVWCDTKYTWSFVGESKDPEQYDRTKEVHEMEADVVFDQLHNLAFHERSPANRVRAVVISGGEPMLQQRQLIPLLKKLKQWDYWIEVETNGTVYPRDEFVSLIDQINCSPKLANSGEVKFAREKEKTLIKLSSLPITTFKFVISDSQDEFEASDMVWRYNMERVYLMPQGITAEELATRRQMVQDIVARSHKSKRRLFFSDRLHITELGGGRGV